MKFKFLLFFIGIIFSQISVGQTDSAETIATVPPDYKNVVRWNITPTAILGFGSWVFGYERVLDNHRSVSANIGFIQMPKFLSSTLDSLQIDRNTDRWGISLASDYRFYFKKRNKLPAPDGLYWGPYFTGYYFNTQTSISVINQDDITSNLYINSELVFLMVGAELGYQFTLGDKNRWTIDLILAGPSIRYDIIDIKIGADVNADFDGDYYQGIYDALTAILPGFKELSTKGEISTSGFTSGFGAGYRYVVQIGYRF